MQSKVYNNLSEVPVDEKLLLEKIKSPFIVNKYSTNNFTEFKKTELTETAKNLTNIHLARKINELYASINDARKVLLKYKTALSTNVETDNDCITPLTESNKRPMLFYKREDLTSIKAYKIRGALYQMSKILEENPLSKLKFVAASTGNHALGVLKAAEILKVSDVTICISESVTEFKKQKLKKRIIDLKNKGINAKLVIKGENFDQTNQFAKNMTESDKYSFYIDPYNTHNAVAGQGTIGLELLSQLEKEFSNSKNSNFDKLRELTVVVPIGGGGLITGVSCALKAGIKKSQLLKNLKLRIIGVHLNDFNSIYGDAIKVKVVGSHNGEFIDNFVGKKVNVDDIDMEKGIDFIYNDIDVKVEGASAGTMKPVFEDLAIPSETNAVVCILSGGNIVF